MYVFAKCVCVCVCGEFGGVRKERELTAPHHFISGVVVFRTLIWKQTQQFCFDPIYLR